MGNDQGAGVLLPSGSIVEIAGTEVASMVPEVFSQGRGAFSQAWRKTRLAKPRQ